MKYTVKITKEVIDEYRSRLKKLSINSETKVNYVKLFEKAVKEKDRQTFFNIMSFVEDWEYRNTQFAKEKKEIINETKTSSESQTVRPKSNKNRGKNRKRTHRRS